MSELKHRLIIVSNRLPIVVGKDKANNISIQQGSGGLVTALVPVLKNRGGIWIGWSGSTDEGIQSEIQEILNESNLKRLIC
jgi:trehalose 6-phosphate synthase